MVFSFISVCVLSVLGTSVPNSWSARVFSLSFGEHVYEPSGLKIVPSLGLVFHDFC